MEQSERQQLQMQQHAYVQQQPGFTQPHVQQPAFGPLSVLPGHLPQAPRPQANPYAATNVNPAFSIQPPVSGSSPADQIAKLKALLDSGAIDEDEFAKAKAPLLAKMFQ